MGKMIWSKVKGIKYMKKFILGLFLISSVASATLLEDVKALNMKPGRENVELKLQKKDGPKDSYFYVDITKNDPDSFEKLVHVIKKLMRQDKYKLNLDIKSFSAFPSGSYYENQRVTFSGTVQN